MPRNEDGEYEIMLGNKQLLSVFFVVVILLAVFFSMGYVLGRRSPVTSAQSRPEALPSPPAASPNGFAETVAPVAGPQSQPAPPETLPVTADPPSSKATTAPEEGRTYLQVRAVKRTDAQLVASVLKKRGFEVVLAPGPTEAVVRVLVGPFTGSEALSKARGELEAAGFDKPFTRKY